ncbi:MAG: DUF3566 domain-containing protein [Ilumatobacteraceae bacterium]
MTTEPSAQRTPSRADRSPATGAPAKEVRTGSKAGPMKRRPSRVEPEPDDVYERLSELADAPADEVDVSEPIPLPEIVEADPSQMLPAPSPDELTEVAEADDEELPADLEPSFATSVDADLATEAVETADPTATNLLVPEAPPLPAPDRTETVPVVPAPAPTEAMPAAVIGEDVDGSFGLVLPQRPLQRPIAFQRGKPRVRRVTRVVRHIDPWSVFKVALVFNTILFLTCLTSGVLLWNVANATGTVDNVENFFEQFGWSSFEFNGGELYHNAWIAGLFIAVGLTGFAVLLATLFNLITDLVGGVRVSVLEEEVVARSSTTIKSRLARLSELDEAG